eukprot:scaffold23222_cov22-Prasinocladus_malaysianus.AAC.1
MLPSQMDYEAQPSDRDTEESDLESTDALDLHRSDSDYSEAANELTLAEAYEWGEDDISSLGTEPPVPQANSDPLEMEPSESPLSLHVDKAEVMPDPAE